MMKKTKISGAQGGRNVVNTTNPGTAATTVASRPEDIIRMRIVGETYAMQELRKNLARAASLDYTITLKGEPGTGKELAARSIHAVSQHSHKRFLAIDSNDFSNEQLTGQLLGFKACNLYDAIDTRSGVFGPDPVGSLLLAQVERMPGYMQDQLLKTLEIADRNEFGGQKGSGLDIQIIVATETDLAALVRSGIFKKELYDRLNAFELTLPPLRERKEDIHPLCWYFFDKYRKELDKPVTSISPEAIETLIDYLFPGNVSELENIIERAVIIADGKTVKRRHLPARLIERKRPEQPVDFSELLTLAEIEKIYILKVLEATGGNKTKTAEILGISRGALWRKIKQLKT
jgi:two-component system response regulator AtoC